MEVYVQDSGGEKEEDQAWWSVPWDLAIHIIVGTIIFLLILTPAVAINLLIHWLVSRDVSAPIIFGLQIAEYALFIADIVLFLVFLGRTSWRAVRNL